MTILTGRPVLSILPKDGIHELSIESSEGKRQLLARQVILAAGTFENTRLVGDTLMALRGEQEIGFAGLNDRIVQGSSWLPFHKANLP